MTFVPRNTEKNCLIPCSEDDIKSGICDCANRIRITLEKKINKIEEKYRGKTLEEWKEYIKKDGEIPIRTQKYILVLEELVESLSGKLSNNPQNYTEDDLRQAFYKGREQTLLPDEKATVIFLRPTFNGYLRELDGKEDPYENFNIRSQSLIDNKDYDLDLWEQIKKLREIQEKYFNKNKEESNESKKENIVSSFCPQCGCNKLQNDGGNYRSCLNILCYWKGQID